MISKVGQRITYTNVVLTLVLVFAMSGGAYAAEKYVITSTKQIKPSVLKSLQGKVGPAGKAGTNGANGANGAQGEKGLTGTNGTNGANGTNGVSVTGTAASPIECEPGGVKYTSASGTNAVCNGKNGTTGFTETLPSGKTETGDWFTHATASGTTFQHVLISFPMPLKAEAEDAAVHPEGPVLGAAKVHYIKAGETSVAECTGSTFEPKAEAGNLCIYENQSSEASYVSSKSLGGNAVEGVASTGTLITFKTTEEEGVAFGTWAVTAP